MGPTFFKCFLFLHTSDYKFQLSQTDPRDARHHVQSSIEWYRKFGDECDKQAMGSRLLTITVTVDGLWRNFSKSIVCDKFPKEATVFFEIAEFLKCTSSPTSSRRDLYRLYQSAKFGWNTGCYATNDMP